MPQIPGPGGGTSVISVNDARKYAQAAGWSGNDITIAVAIALAESGLDTLAYNPEVSSGTPVGEGSYGLWQVYYHVHKDIVGSNPQVLYDPATNAKMAHQVYVQQGWGAWSTYNKNTRGDGQGVYLKYMNQAGAGIGGPIQQNETILPNAVAISEWSSPGSANGGTDGNNGCTQAALVVAAHILGKAPGTVAELNRFLRMTIQDGKADPDGSMNSKDVAAEYKKAYGITVVNAIGNSALGSWQAALHKYIKDNVQIPLVVQVGKAYAFGGHNSNINGHAVCIVGWDRKNGLYIVADPNTDEATSGSFVKYTEAQFSAAAPFAVWVPPDQNVLQLWLSAIGAVFDAGAQQLGQDVAAGWGWLVQPITSIGDFFSGMSAFLSKTDTTVNTAMKQAPGVVGIAEELDQVESLIPVQWDTLGHVAGSLFWNAKALAVRGAGILIGLMIFTMGLVALLLALNEAIGGELGKGIGGGMIGGSGPSKAGPSSPASGAQAGRSVGTGTGGRA